MNVEIAHAPSGQEPVSVEMKSHPGPVVGRVVLFWFAFGLLVVGSGSLGGMAPRGWAGFVCGIIGSAGMLAFTWWLLRRDRLNLQDVGLAWRRGSVARFLIGGVIGVGLFAVLAGIGALFGGLRWERSPEVGLAALALSAITFLALNSLEELGFRGYPLRMLERPLGLWGAQAVVAVVFGLSHYVQGWPLHSALLGAGMGSLVFGMAAIASRGLAMPIGVHAAGNLTDWMLGGKGPGGLWKVVIAEESRGRSELVGALGYCAVMAAVTAGFWLWHRQNQKHTEILSVSISNS